MISVIIPAHNEETYICSCLWSLLRSSEPVGPAPIQVIVVANGCTDQTAAKVQAMRPDFEQKGWPLNLLTLEQGGKAGALNAGDGAARYGTRVYIDADVQVSPNLLQQLAQVLDRPEAAYAGGQPQVPKSASFISDRYAQFWQKLPFVTQDVPGFGVYAVNPAGRDRWAAFPDIISDDSFVRCHFKAEERYRVFASYQWPITEGFANLVRVRRRQNEGLSELRSLYPALAAEMDSTTPGPVQKWRLLRMDPVGFVIYATVAVVVKLPVLRNRSGWDRGR